jgi:hypothetical protein
MNIRTFTTLAVCIVILNMNIFALTGGPTQPEFASFEPVDVTDLVNTPTGDFTYVVPLGEVKTPGGVGYPVTLAYHAGIMHEQEATWVGLGWTLNPGAINRVIRGFADDYDGEWSSSKMFDPGQTGWNFNLGVGYAGVSASIGWNEKGFQGITSVGLSFPLGTGSGKSNPFSLNLSYNVQAGSFSIGPGVGGSLGKAFTAGGGVGLTFGKNGDVSAYAGVSLGARAGKGSVGLLSFGMSTKGGAGFSVAGGSMSTGSFTNAGSVSWFESSSLTIPIPPVPTLSIDLSYSSWGWYYNQMIASKGYGTIYANSPSKSLKRHVTTDNVVLATILGEADDESGGWSYYLNEPSPPPVNSPSPPPAGAQPPADYKRLYDRNEIIANEAEFSFPAQDLYTVTGQGISGTFKPFISEMLTFGRLENTTEDEVNGVTDGIVGVPSKSADGIITYTNLLNDFTCEVKPQFTSCILFKMCAENSLNAIDACSETYATYPTGGFNNDLAMIDPERKATGTRIDPVFGLEGFSKRHLGGFVLTDQEGKSYYYTLPLHNLETVSITQQGTNESYRKDQGVYATTWLLRAVTGPDYVKNDWSAAIVEGNSEADALLPHAGDFGYWVKFNYSYGLPVKNTNGTLELDDTKEKERIISFPWRDPYSGSHSYTENTKTVNNYMYGLKEETYLQSIETATEVAYFRTTPRYDGQGMDENKYPITGDIQIDKNNVYIPPDFFSYSTSNKPFVVSYSNWKKTGYVCNMKRIAAENERTIKKTDIENWIKEFDKPGSVIPTPSRCPFLILKVDGSIISQDNYNKLKPGDVVGSIFFEGNANYRNYSFWPDLFCGSSNESIKGELKLIKDESGCTISDDASAVLNKVMDISIKGGWLFRTEQQKSFNSFWVQYHCMQGFTPALKCFYYYKILKDILDPDGPYNLYICAMDYRAGDFVTQGDGIMDVADGSRGDDNYRTNYRTAIPIGPLETKRGTCYFRMARQDIQRSGYGIPEALGGFNNEPYINGACISANLKPFWSRNFVTHYSKKLDEIAWYSKTTYPFLTGTLDPANDMDMQHYNDMLNAIYPGQTLAPPISYKRVNLSYDYSLALGTPNSTAPNGQVGKMNCGRLALRAVQFGAGAETNGAAMPPYIFNYQNSNILYSGMDNEDLWGFNAYSKSGPTGTGPITTKSSDVNYEFDPQHGVCWNLSKVELPSGGIIEVAYERDKAEGPEWYLLEQIKSHNYFQIKNLTDLGLSIQTAPDPQYPFRNNHGYTIDYRFPGNNCKFRIIANENELKVGSVCVFRFPHGYTEVTPPGCATIPFDLKEMIAFYYTITKVENPLSGTIEITLDRPFTEPDAITLTYIYPPGVPCAGETKSYTFTGGDFRWTLCPILPKPFWGGDLRVTSVKSSSLSGTAILSYNYPYQAAFEVLPQNAIPQIANNFSKKAVPHINVPFSNSGSWFVLDSTFLLPGESARFAYPFANTMECRYNHGSTQFIYPIVDVYSANPAAPGNTLNGVTRYHYHTCKDSVEVNGMTEPIISEKTFTYTESSTNYHAKQIIDRAGIVCMVDSIESFANPTGNVYASGALTKRIKVSRNRYKFSEELADGAGVYYGGIDDDNRIASSDKKMLGLTRERSLTKFYNSGPKSFTNAGLSDVIISRPFQVSTETVSDNVTALNSNGLFDAATGDPMATLVKNSDNKSKVDLKIPYAYVCPDNQKTILSKKNMYTLQAGTVVADVTNGSSEVHCHDLSIETILSSASAILSASAQKYDTLSTKMSYTKDAETIVLTQYRMYPDLSYSWKGNGAFEWPWDNDGLWRKNSEVLSVDKYLRPQTELNAKNIPTTAQYLPRTNSVSALIQNASYDECGVFTADYDEFDHYIDYNSGTSGPGYFDSTNRWEKGGVFNDDGKCEITGEQKHFGNRSLHVKNSYGMGKNIYKIIPDKDYLFSAWIYPLDANKMRMVVEPRVEGNPPTQNFDDEITGLPANQWTYWQVRIKGSDLKTRGITGTNGDYLRIWIGNYPGDVNPADFYVDDIRFYPISAQVSTFYYNHNLCVPITFVDVNNKCKRFEYDEFGRLTKTMDNASHVLKTATYSSGLKQITVKSPRSGSIYLAGTEVPISWDYKAFLATLRFSLSIDGGTNWVDFSGNDYFTEKTQLTPWDNTLRWRIPTTITASDNCIIKIKDMSAGGDSGMSQRFIIVAPSGDKVTKPVPDRVIKEESTDTIRLVNAFTGVSMVDIYFYDGEDWDVAKTGAAYTGGPTAVDIIWDIPYQGKENTNAHYKIIGKDAANNVLGTIYSNVFTVARRSYVIRRWMMYIFGKK